MAGFTINGFGASDSYYVMKGLQAARCPNCRKETQWALMELKMKIRLLYIPTVSVGTKYAVACTKCKNGYYVDERQRDFILNNPADLVEITEEGVVLQGINADTDAEETPVEEIEIPKAPVVQEVPSLSQKEVSAIFLPENPKPAQKSAPEHTQPVSVSYRPRKICPSCRMMFPPEKEVCTICGTALREK